MFVKNSFALEMKCKFEEVYLNGQTTNGFILIKNENLRYEYFDKKLFGLIYKENQLFQFDNSKINNVRKINQQKELFESLHNLFKNYPNISNEYKINEYTINIFNSNVSNFIQRISIKSKKLNLSLYLVDCKKTSISDIFFNVSPAIRYYYYE